MKESKCFSCKESGYTTYNCLKKRKIAAISKDVSENTNSQGKK